MKHLQELQHYDEERQMKWLKVKAACQPMLTSTEAHLEEMQNPMKSNNIHVNTSKLKDNDHKQGYKSN